MVTTTSSVSAPPVATPVPPPAGLAAPDSDPELVALMRNARRCPRALDRYDLTCPAFRAFANATAGKDEPTLLNALEDQDPIFRRLALYALHESTGMAYPKNKAQAARIVAAAERQNVDKIDVEVL